MAEYKFKHLAPACVAALLGGYVLAVHAVFLFNVPDPIIQSDSGSYLRPALSLLYDRHIDLPPERTPGYPLFLYLLLRLGASFTVLLGVQHLLLIGTGLLAAFMGQRYLKLSPGCAYAVGGFSSLSLSALVASHTLLTETAYSFIALAGLACVLEARTDKREGIWGLTGFCAAMALWVRPSGWALVAAMGTGLALLIQKKKRAGWRAGGMGVAVTLLALSPVYYWNATRYHAFGLTLFTGVSLFGTTARYLPVEQVADSDVRRVLMPFYTDARLASSLADGNWVRYSKDGPAEQVRRLVPAPAARDRLFSSLGAQAIRNHPFRFLKDQVAACFDFITTRSAVPDIYLQRDLTFFIYRGLWLFQANFSRWPDALKLLKHSPGEARAYLDALARVQRGPAAQAEAALAQVHQQDLYHYDRVLRLFAPMALVGVPLMRWLPWMAFLAGLALVKDPDNRSVVAILGTYILTHILLTTLGGDADTRHALPLEPVYWILVLAGLQQTFRKQSRIR